MSPLADSQLSRFHPILGNWFSNKFGTPTEVQEKAWSLIAARKHCLISAATGSGKTLAAFLWGINQLASGDWELGQTRLLYISPLKALNNDIRRNLLEPLGELRLHFEKEGHPWPEIRVMTRSGDTDQADRRKMLRHPPEILITTPESLNLLLTSRDGQQALLGVESLILDEIHSVVGSKRGVYLMTGVERLAHLNGEFQRIALSATVKPMDTVASYVGGFEKGVPRGVERAESVVEKQYDILVNLPEDIESRGEDEDFWQPIVEDLKRLIAANDSTLIFVNSRMLSEKIAHRINLDEEKPIAYSHHGSLSREIRFSVEQRLKNGDLKAIVATNSLEMGIDVGALDCVVMIQCPNTISSAIQKVGRAGHQVGAVSHAVVYPSHSKDFLESAVLSDSIRKRDIESVVPVDAPLDVLAQVIVSILGTNSWDIDELFALLKDAYPYRGLRREAYDLVVNMLAGRYAGSRLRELKPRIAIDRTTNKLTNRKGALLAFYFSGGVIPDRGYFHLRLSGDGARIGELDEEFVWEASEGDVFTLGVQSWQIEKITHNDVIVHPASARDMAPPFWKAERYDRDFHFSNRMGEFLEWANEQKDEDAFEKALKKRFRMSPKAAKSLQQFLVSQKKATGRDLPHRHHVLVEILDVAPGGSPGKQLIMHTHWGGKVNRPFALALDAAWAEAFSHRTEVYVNNDCVVVTLSEAVEVSEVLDLVDIGNVDTMLRKRLEGSGFFGARFREAAGTSLLITKNKPGQRLPLWLSRMRAKKLFESVQQYDDFPLLLEAWRTCLKDDFDMESLREVLSELESGDIAISVAYTKIASPFAADVAWRQINDEYMYATDQANASGESHLREDLVRTIAFDSENRPQVSKEIIRAFEQKRKRLEDGYEPTDALELKEWLRDRVAIQEDEWRKLCSLLPDAKVEVSTLKLGGFNWVYLLEERGRTEGLFCAEPNADMLLEWLSYFGPVSEEWLQKLFDEVAVADWNALLEELEDDRRIVRGLLVSDEEGSTICEAENFETLLRMNRAKNRPSFVPLSIDMLALYLAEWQGVVTPGKGVEAVRSCIDRCLGWAAGVLDWEKQIFAARVAEYSEFLIDTVLVEDGAVWLGYAPGKIGLCLAEDLGTVRGTTSGLSYREESVMDILSTGARYSFVTLQELLECPAGELEETLWRLVWKGRASNDAFAAARRGALGKFEICRISDVRKSTPGVRMRRYGGGGRRMNAITYPGNWYALPIVEQRSDAVDVFESQRERARIVLDRYGIVFRELLEREERGFRWSDVSKALRLLELSGEVVGGRFFEDVSGLQFASLEGLRRLRKALPEQAIYWLGATDPASVCGLQLEALRGKSTKRLVGNRLVYRGSERVVESQRDGKSLTFFIGSDDPDLPQIITTLAEALDLHVRTHLKLETINDEDARSSPYLESICSILRCHQSHKHVVIEGMLE